MSHLSIVPVVLNILGGAGKSAMPGLLTRLPGFETACEPFFDKPMFLTTLYCLSGVLCVFIWENWNEGSRVPITDPRLRTIVIQASICNIGAEACIFTAVFYISASLVEMEVFCAKMLCTALIVTTFRGVKLRWNHIIAMISAMLGVILITVLSPSESHADVKNASLIGTIWSILAGGFYAYKIILVEELTHDWGIKDKAVVVYINKICLYMCLVIMPIAWSVEGPDCGKLEAFPDTWDKLTGQVAIPYMAAFWLWFVIAFFFLACFGVNLGMYKMIEDRGAFEKCLWDIFKVVTTWAMNIIIRFGAFVFDPETLLGDPLDWDHFYPMMIGLLLGAVGMYFFFLQRLDKDPGAIRSTAAVDESILPASVYPAHRLKTTKAPTFSDDENDGHSVRLATFTDRNALSRDDRLFGV